MSERGRGRGGYRGGGRGQPPQGRGSGGGRGNYNNQSPYGNRVPFPSTSTAQQPPFQAQNSGGRGQGRGGMSGRGNDHRTFVNLPTPQSIASSSSSSVMPSPPVTQFQNLSINSTGTTSVGTGASDPVQPQPSSMQMQQSKADQDLPLVPSSSELYKWPARPGSGTLGKKCIVKANHFLVDLGNRDPYQYDVTISPEVTSKTKCRHIMKCLIEQYQTSHLGNRRLAYDGKKNAFAAGQLPFDSKEFVITVPENNGREREFKVTVKFAAKKDLDHLRGFLNGRQYDNAQETIQALDVVIRESALQGREVIGRSIYSDAFGKGPLTGGMEYWRGFYQSLRPTQMGLSLNIDMSARPFYETILVSDFVKDLLNKDVTRPLSDQERIKVKKALRGVKVEVSHGDTKRTYKIHGITTQTTNQLSFPVDENGTTISVVQYFRQKYNITLRFPYLPAIQAGTDAKPIYLPMEICRIAGNQRYTKKLNERQVTQMLKATCQRPHEREKKIDSVLKRNSYNQDGLVKEDFGMQVNEHFTEIEARVLQPPSLKYHNSGGQSEVKPHVGQWNMMNLKMFNGGIVNHWAIINFSRQREEEVMKFCYGIISMCIDRGMTFNRRYLIPPQSAAPHNIERALFDLHDRCSAELARVAPRDSLHLLFVILPETSSPYGTIKRILETELGIVSQCCKAKHVFKSNRQYFENLSMKINVKVGGRNAILSYPQVEIAERLTIIFGADVTHPQPGEDSGPSIAAVVASMDWPYVTKYRALVSAQPHRQEIIEDLFTTCTNPKTGAEVSGGMIIDHLRAFGNATNRLPDRIIFYRDGVSEGQFNDVLLYEVDKIRRACVSLKKGYLPRVTFIVVQKRHHTRLFPMNYNDRASTDKSGNILPGTVVDTKICHPSQFDFYLCSHAGIQGTSRPVHYHVLYDENNFTADGIQTLSNNLCYTYARCTKSVSIVPPAYYAHLAAFRARYYTEGSVAGSESGVGASRERAGEVRRLPTIHDNVKSVMFYC